MTKKLSYQQQGDVLIFKVVTMPANVKGVPAVSGRFILASGEHTNHHHAIVECPEVEMFGDDKGVLYLSVKKPVALKHEEHQTQTIAPGTYRVGRVVEVDPFTEEVRKVQD